MSRAQGDGFKTWTNNDLNAYKKRLDARLAEMRQETARWYDNGDGFWVLAESWNVLENPNGNWKWDGWKVVGKEYKVAVFDESDLKIEDGKVKDVNGWSIAQQTFSDRKRALEFFKACRA